MECELKEIVDRCSELTALIEAGGVSAGARHAERARLQRILAFATSRAITREVDPRHKADVPSTPEPVSAAASAGTIGMME
jgi:hypothetical protein